MSWQDRLRLLGDRLSAGDITTAEYRVASEDILAEADRAAAAETQPAPTGETDTPKVRIPVSAAWEAPSGEMTQIVGTDDRTSVVNTSIADKLEQAEDQA